MPWPGTLSPDRKRWTPSGPLAYGATYTWGGTATGPGGGSSPVTGSFTTVAPGQTVRATLNIGDDREVGVAAPITIQFAAPVEDKAAVERALQVRTSVPTEGSWAWLPDQDGGSRVHWRPKEYWRPGTQVDVRANLLGTPFGGGAWGREDLTTSFKIGRSQVVQADVNSFRMVVIRDGQQVMDVPASYGTDSDPNRTTRSGIHVVSEKFTNKRMVSEQYGYDLVERWAVRISNNGEFIHANPASTGAQGSSNVTHGCINLSRGRCPGVLRHRPVRRPGGGHQLRGRTTRRATATSTTGPSRGRSGRACPRSRCSRSGGSASPWPGRGA